MLYPDGPDGRFDPGVLVSMLGTRTGPQPIATVTVGATGSVYREFSPQSMPSMCETSSSPEAIDVAKECEQSEESDSSDSWTGDVKSGSRKEKVKSGSRKKEVKSGSPKEEVKSSSSKQNDILLEAVEKSKTGKNKERACKADQKSDQKKSSERAIGSGGRGYLGMEKGFLNK